MTAPRYQAWRFAHPVADASASRPGLGVLPSGRIELVQGDRSVRQALLLLLSTVPGERVMRPDYGCDLNLLVFSPNDATTAGLAMHYVRQAVTRWEPRVEIVRLDAEADPERPEQLNILLAYRVRATLKTHELIFPVHLSGEEL